MANIDKQYTNFLGGEVSNRLYHRADMAQFGKWFSEATNIRFWETGSFRNREGFKHVAYTKNAKPGEIVKIISFSFNDEQSYLIELGATDGVGYARFFQNGQPILVNGEPYEIESPYFDLTNQTFRWAQSGDILFITNEKYGIYELRRLKADGTQWEFKKFDSKVMPLGDVNSNEEYHLSGEEASLAQDLKKVVTLPTKLNDYFKGAELYVNGQKVWDSNATMSLTELESSLSTYFADFNTTVTRTGYTFTFECPNFEAEEIDTIRIVAGTVSTTEVVTYSNITSRDFSIDCNDKKGIKSITIKAGSWYGADFLPEDHYTLPSYHMQWNVESDLKYDVIQDSSLTLEDSWLDTASQINSWMRTYNVVHYSVGHPGGRRGIIPFVAGTNKGPIASVSFDSALGLLKFHHNPNNVYWHNPTDNRNHRPHDRDCYGSCDTTYEIEFYTGTTTSADSQDISVDEEGVIAIEANHKFFDNMNEGDTFAVRQYMQTEIINGHYDNSGMSETVKGKGSYRYYTSGNWKGNLEVQYSIDKGVTWKQLHYISSNNENAPGNDNTSGDVTYDDLVLFRIKYDITAGNVNVVFETAPYEVWSYYKVKSKVNDYKAYAKCLKNDVGSFSNCNEFKKNAFSQTLGYPSCIGFYQNRLFFGKEWILYGSAVGDFWNFYERAEEPQDDDAIQMSLLSYKVNNIRNIATQRSFYVFTEGAEFGIGSEGALTQNDKFMKQLSAHGSANCEFIICGDVIIFIDKCGHIVRAMAYSLESDSYKATDISIFTSEKMEYENFICADYSADNQEGYFVSSTGNVWVMKYLPEQNILAWSRWQHAVGQILELRVVPNGAKDDIYVLVKRDDTMSIEIMGPTFYMDSCVELKNEEPVSRFKTTFGPSQEVTVITSDGDWYLVNPDDEGYVEIDRPLKEIIYGIVPISTATLLTPTVQQEDMTLSSHIINKPFKVFFFYTQSYGFVVGASDDDKYEIAWQNTNTSTIDEEVNLTSGHKTVLINSKFGYDNRVSFSQRLPYPMDVQDVLIVTDFGGK